MARMRTKRSVVAAVVAVGALGASGSARADGTSPWGDDPAFAPAAPVASATEPGRERSRVIPVKVAVALRVGLRLAGDSGGAPSDTPQTAEESARAAAERRAAAETAAAHSAVLQAALAELVARRQREADERAARAAGDDGDGAGSSGYGGAGSSGSGGAGSGSGGSPAYGGNQLAGVSRGGSGSGGSGSAGGSGSSGGSLGGGGQPLRAGQALTGTASQAPQATQAAQPTQQGPAEQQLEQALRQLVQAAGLQGSARQQAQEQALNTLQGVQNDPSADARTRSRATDAIRHASLQAGVVSQHQMGQEVEPLLSAEFKKKLTGGTSIGARICGIASLRMLAEHLGLVQRWTPQDTKKYLEGPEAIYIPNQGTDHAKLAQAVTKLGCPASFSAGGGVSAMRQALDRGKPVITLARGNLAHVGTVGSSGFQAERGGKSWRGHFFLVVGYTPYARQSSAEKAASGGQTLYTVNDPDRAKRFVVTESALSAVANGIVDPR